MTQLHVAPKTQLLQLQEMPIKTVLVLTSKCCCLLTKQANFLGVSIESSGSNLAAAYSLGEAPNQQSTHEEAQKGIAQGAQAPAHNTQHSSQQNPEAFTQVCNTSLSFRA